MTRMSKMSGRRKTTTGKPLATPEGDDILTSAACNICGKRLTKREFRACHSGHFCDKHRKPPLPIETPSRKPVASKPQAGGKRDARKKTPAKSKKRQ